VPVGAGTLVVSGGGDVDMVSAYTGNAGQGRQTNLSFGRRAVVYRIEHMSNFAQKNVGRPPMTG
jgi:hypothetical protein